VAVKNSVKECPLVFFLYICNHREYYETPCILYLRTIHVHLKCLSLLCTFCLCDKYIKCKTNPRRHRIQCLLQIKHDTLTLLIIFNVLPCLPSHLLATCEGTTVLYTIWRRTQIGVKSRPSFLLVICRCSFSVSRLGRFIPDTHWIVGFVGFISYLNGLEKRENSCPCWE